MLRIACLKCAKFFDSKDKKTNRLCPHCKQENKQLRACDIVTVFKRKHHTNNAGL